RVTRRGKRGLALTESVSETGWRRDEVAKHAVALIEEGLLVRFQDRTFAEAEFGLARQTLLDAVAAFHKSDPLKAGKAKGEMQDEMTRVFEMAPELFEAALAHLIREKKLEVTGDLVRLAGH